MHGFMSTQLEGKKALQWFSTPQVKSHFLHANNFTFAKPRASDQTFSNRGKASHQAEAPALLHWPGQAGQSVPGSEYSVFKLTQENKRRREANGPASS